MTFWIRDNGLNVVVRGFPFGIITRSVLLQDFSWFYYRMTFANFKEKENSCDPHTGDFHTKSILNGCKAKELSPVEFRFLMDPLDPQSGVPLMAVGNVE